MNNNALRVEWSPRIMAEIEEAKSLYRQARIEGRKITTLEGAPVEHFRSTLGAFIIAETELKENEYGLRILDETGDRRIIWDCADGAQVAEAGKLFEDYLKRGWRAYAVDAVGKKGRRVFGFDPFAQEIFIDEKSAREKLATFRDKQFVLLPRTYPG